MSVSIWNYWKFLVDFCTTKKYKILPVVDLTYWVQSPFDFIYFLTSKRKYVIIKMPEQAQKIYISRDPFWQFFYVYDCDFFSYFFFCAFLDIGCFDHLTAWPTLFYIYNIKDFLIHFIVPFSSNLLSQLFFLHFSRILQFIFSPAFARCTELLARSTVAMKSIRGDKILITEVF